MESGFYPESFALHLQISAPGLDIHYTTDGTAPTTADLLYDPVQGISIYDRSEEENNYSNIPTAKQDWFAPQGKVKKGTVVWAQAFDNQKAYGPPAIFSYFINIEHRFPVFSLVGRPEDLFSDSLGILVPGDLYDLQDNIAGNAGMRGRDWERPMQLEFFEDGLLRLRQNIGARIHGLSSRSLPQKSLRLYARNEYGKKYFEYPFFPHASIQRFKRLILRSPQSDWSDTFFKDEMIHQLTKESMDLDIQEYLPSVVYINGEYWGIYNLRERQDEHYLSERYNIDKDHFDLLEFGGGIIEGDNQAYLDLLQFATVHDLSLDKNYQQVADRIDIQNFVDYHITHLFFANQDWPKNNYKFWRSEQTGLPWRWFFFDCDFCMIYHHDDHLGVFLDNTIFEAFNRQGEEFPDWSVLMLHKLLQNEAFKASFTAQLFEAATGLFSASRLIREIDKFEELYAPEVIENIRRWSNPGNFDIWQNNVNDLRQFALQRPPYILQRLRSLSGSPFSVYPNPTKGNIHISSILDVTGEMQIEIFTGTGQKVFTQQLDGTAASNRWDIADIGLPGGYYTLVIRYRQVRFAHPLIII